MDQQQEPLGGRGDAGMQNTTRTADVPAGSRTLTEPQTEPQAPILRLRGAQRNRGPRVQWAEGVVDNEGMGKKKSKGAFPTPRALPPGHDVSLPLACPLMPFLLTPWAHDPTQSAASTTVPKE